MHYDLTFYRIVMARNGRPVATNVGLGTDGELFVALAEIEARPEDLRKRPPYPGTCPLVVMNELDGRAYVNARAVADLLVNPADRARMCSTIEWVLGGLKAYKDQRHDTAATN